MTKIQVRRDSATNWTNANPVLDSGEFGYETDTGNFKIGDGSSAWDTLSYFSGGGGSGPYAVTNDSIYPVTGDNVVANTVGTTDWGVINGGMCNEISGDYAVIGGGYQNKAEESLAVVGGGQYNMARSLGAVVVGGVSNTAIGQHSSLLGGTCNEVSGDHAVLGGGYANRALNQSAIVVGGNHNAAWDVGSVVVGGEYNNASGPHSSVLGGSYNDTNFQYNAHIIGSQISADQGNTTFVNNLKINGILGSPGVIIFSDGTSMSTAPSGGGGGGEGGAGPLTIDASSNIYPINGNTQRSYDANSGFIGGGQSNGVSGSYAVAVGGYNNRADSENAVIGGGYSNSISNFSPNSVIAGGYNNIVQSGNYCSIIGGSNNRAGYNDNVHIIGSGICADAPNYTYVNNLRVMSGGLRITNIPTSDPNIPGVVWSDGGTLKISV